MLSTLFSIGFCRFLRCALGIVCLWLAGAWVGAASAGSLELAAQPPAARSAGLPGEDLSPAAPLDAPYAPAGRPLSPLPKGFSVERRGWIEFAFHASRRHRVEPLMAEADAFRERTRDLFGMQVLQPVRVRVGRSAGEMSELSLVGAAPPAYAVGLAYPSHGLILLTLEPRYYNRDYDLAETLRHELAHLALADALQGAEVPLWLNEGFAIHLSGESILARLQALSTATLSGSLIPLKELSKRFPNDIVGTPVAYAQAADLVRHLLRAGDSERFVAMLRRIRGGQPFEAALLDSYGVDSAQLEVEWRKEVAKRYSFWPIGGLVWALAIGLLGVAYVRRRRQQKRTLERWAREEAAEEARGVGLVPRMRVVLTPSESRAEVAPEVLLSRTVDVPKVEHDGSWHTLH